MFERIRALVIAKVPRASGAFLGLGVLQGWMTALQSASQDAMTADAVTAFGRVTLYVDIGSVPVFLALLLLAGRIVPLWTRKAPRAVSAVAMYAGVVFVALAMVVSRGISGLQAGSTPFPSPFSEPSVSLVLLGLVLAGAGTAVSLLCWWELYASLSLLEVALYCSGSWIVREFVVVALRGYGGAYLLSAMLILPLVAFAMLDAAQRRVAPASVAASVTASDSAPEPAPVSFAIAVPRVVSRAGSGSPETPFPWKPMVLVALYAFAYGCGTWLLRYQDDLYMHAGMVLPAVIVCAAILVSSKWFNFTVVHRVILPVATVGFLTLLLVGDETQGIVTVFVRASYSSVFLYVSVWLCNLSRRYGISAAWLFSLFNIVHIVFLGCGTLLFNALPSLVVVGACIACILLSTFIIVSDPSFDLAWRVVLTRRESALVNQEEQARLEMTVDALARQYGLSARQGEILLFLAQGDLPRSIGNKLGISPGTVKAHVQHIYKKLGIHSKDELDALMGR